MEIDGFRGVTALRRGGLASLYRATRVATGGLVALKYLAGTDQAALEAARHEVDVMLRLKGHPHVIGVEDLVRAPGGYAIVMEYAASGSLSDRLHQHRGPLPQLDIALAGSQIAAALEAAHRLSIVHRDIKPSNVLVTAFGSCRVADFGTADIEWKTTRGPSLLTPQYASPEELQAPGTGGPSADVFSLGATMLHLLIDQVPEAGIRNEWLDVRAADPLSRLIQACLATERDRRPTTDQLIDQLDQLAHRDVSKRLRGLPTRRLSLADLDDAACPSAGLLPVADRTVSRPAVQSG